MSALAWRRYSRAISLLASSAADRMDFVGFTHNARRVNCYDVGARVTRDQDKNEGAFNERLVRFIGPADTAPI